MTKHTTKPSAEVDVAERSPSVWGRPFGQIDFDEWFDRWPELFARRWPDSFRGFPGTDTPFKLEDFTARLHVLDRDFTPGLLFQTVAFDQCGLRDLGDLAFALRIENVRV